MSESTPEQTTENGLAPRSYRWAAVIIVAAGVGKTWLTLPDTAMVAAGLGYMMALWLLTTSMPTLTTRAWVVVATLLLLLIIERSNNEALIAFAPLTPIVALAGGIASSVVVTVLVVVWAGVVDMWHQDDATGTSQILLSMGGAGLFMVEFSRLLLLERAHTRALTLQSARIAELSATLERQRVAQQMHDGVGHYLSAAIVHLEAARIHRATDPERADASIDQAQSLIADGMSEVRWAVTALQGRSLPSLGDALRELVDASTNAGIETHFRCHGVERRLPTDAGWALYTSLQESLTNIRRHAQAQRVDIVLRYLDDGIELTVVDNGIGVASVEPGNGLRAIAERASAFGGRCRWASAPGSGFELWLRLSA